MKKLIILSLVLANLHFLAEAKVVTEKTTVLFNTAKYNLTEQSISSLEDFIKKYLVTKDYEITIEGHTDNRGSINYNKELSTNRAEEVKRFLVGLGVDKSLVKIKYLGELDPEKPNINDKNREVNRRVEVVLTTFQFDNIQELENALDPNKTTRFIIKSNEETVVEGKKGVKVLIREGSFVYEDGSLVNEDVEFELTESLSFKDFISSGLATKTADDLLETGGMIKVAAKTVSGKSVSIKEDTPMLIAVPNDNRQEGMEVFASEKGDEWEAKNQPIQMLTISSVQDYPRMNYTTYPLPQFLVDKSDYPEKPSKPYLKREPKAPNREGYNRRVRWHQVFNKKELKKKEEVSYNRAVELYQKRSEKYDLAVIKHETRLKKYKQDMLSYDAAVVAWNKKLEEEKKVFQQTEEFQKAFKKHEAYNAYNKKKFKEEVAKWRADRKDKIGKMGQDMDKLGITTASALNNYVFAFNELKWINVDRFYHLDEAEKQLITLEGDVHSEDEERVFILFENIESMLPMYKYEESDTYVQENFPKKEPAAIFAYKVKDGKPYLCYQMIDGSENYELDFEESSFAEIKAILSQYDGPKKS